MIRRLATLLPLFLVALVSAGCVVASAEHPASKAHDSSKDDELVGWWALRAPADMGSAEVENEGAELDRGQVRLLVGRGEDSSRLEWLLVHLSKETRIETLRGSFRATQLGGRWIVSRFPQNEQDDWWLSRVLITPEGPVGHEDLDPEAVARAIETGAVEGRVTRNDDGGLEHARLTADTEALRAWIASKGDAIWKDTRMRWVRDPVPPYRGRCAVRLNRGCGTRRSGVRSSVWPRRAW